MDVFHDGHVAVRFIGAALPVRGDMVFARDFEHADGRMVIDGERMQCDTCGLLFYLDVVNGRPVALTHGAT